MASLLIVEDNESLCFVLKNLLIEEGYEAQSVTTLAALEESLESRHYDLVLLDWMLPDGSGVEWLRNARTVGWRMPVLLFSSKSEIKERVEALDAGADDYLPKPFSNLELLARIRALLRRESSIKQESLQIGEVTIDFKSRHVTVAGNRVKLSTKEFELLAFMARHLDTVLTKYQLLEQIRQDYDQLPTSNIVEAHIKNLRKKLGRPDLIETVRGIGYVIRRA
ncbi:response regulator transcription factor [Hydrogenimonas sp.]